MNAGGTLTVATAIIHERKESGEDWLQIRISDTGPGIPDEVKESLFDPFVKGKDYKYYLELAGGLGDEADDESQGDEGEAEGSRLASS